MTVAGDLNRRLALLAPVETDDGAGGVTRSYETAAMVWAQVLPLAARADMAAGSLGAALRARIVIRYRDDVTTRHRFQDGTHVYRILAARRSSDRRFLEVEAEERED
jgi:SPP1 family predicted phage head-tail adaptor